MEAPTLNTQNVIAIVAIVAGMVSGWTGNEALRGPTYPKPAADRVIRGLSAVVVRQEATIARQQEEIGQCRENRNGDE